MLWLVSWKSNLGFPKKFLYAFPWWSWTFASASESTSFKNGYSFYTWPVYFLTFSSVFSLLLNLIIKHLIVQERQQPNVLPRSIFLFFCRINPETICYVQYFFTPWLSMYWRITSTGAPPAVSRQKLWLQKASFLLFLKLDCQWLFLRYFTTMIRW